MQKTNSPRRDWDDLAAVLGAHEVQAPAEARAAVEYAEELAAMLGDFARYDPRDDVAAAAGLKGAERRKALRAIGDRSAASASGQAAQGTLGETFRREASARYRRAWDVTLADPSVLDGLGAAFDATAEEFATAWRTLREHVRPDRVNVDDRAALLDLGAVGVQALGAQMAASAAAERLDLLADVRMEFVPFAERPRGDDGDRPVWEVALTVGGEAFSLDTAERAVGVVRTRTINRAGGSVRGLGGWGRVLDLGLSIAWADPTEHARRWGLLTAARGARNAAATDRQFGVRPQYQADSVTLLRR